MAKLNRESKLRDKRAIKAARKDERKRAAGTGEEPTYVALRGDDEDDE